MKRYRFSHAFPFPDAKITIKTSSELTLEQARELLNTFHRLFPRITPPNHPDGHCGNQMCCWGPPGKKDR